MSDMDEPRDGTYRSLQDACETFLAGLPPSRTPAETVKRDALRREASHHDFYKRQSFAARGWNGKAEEESHLRRALMFQDNYARLRATF